MLHHEGALYSPRKRAFSMGQPCLIRTRFVFLLGAVVTCSANQCTDGMSKCVNDAKRMFASDGFPGSKQELDKICSNYYYGMKCVRDFSSACLKQDQIQVLESSLHGVTQTMHLLCKDEEFQKEYLKEAVCYKRMSGDWELCTEQMQKMLEADTINKTKQENMDQMCSATTLFLRCTEEGALKNCSESATKLLLAIANSLFGTALRESCSRTTNDSKPTLLPFSEDTQFQTTKNLETPFTKSYPKSLGATYGNNSLGGNGFPSPHSSSASGVGSGLLFLLMLLVPVLFIT